MVQRYIIYILPAQSVAQNTLTQMVQRYMRAMDATILEVVSGAGIVAVRSNSQGRRNRGGGGGLSPSTLK